MANEPQTSPPIGNGNLIIARHLNESVKIGEDIYIEVVEIIRGKVRLRITAPRCIPIYRTELLKQDGAAAIEGA